MAGGIVSPTLVFVPELELIILYVTSFSAAIFVLYWWYRSYRKLGISIKAVFQYIRENWKSMIIQALSYGAFHKKTVKNRFAGVMHLLIFYGMLILFISTALIALSHDLLKPVFHFGILVGTFYLNFEVWADTGGVMLMAGLFMALYRRLAKRIKLESVFDDYILISGLLILSLEGFILGALKIALFRNGFDIYRYIEWYLSYTFPSGMSLSTGIQVYRELWLVHILTAFVLAIYLPFSKFSHIALSWTNVTIKKFHPRGELTTPFVLSEALETGNLDFSVGAKEVLNLPTTMKIDSLACTNCGRCERACPAVLAGSDLDPRIVVQNVKTVVYNGKVEMVPGILSENAAWSCTTCQACVEECPVLIDPHSFVIESRRNLVMENKLTKEMSQYFNNLTNTQNPYGNSPADRDALLKFGPKYDSSKDVLYWVGCMGAFDPKGKKVAETVMGLLNKAGVNFGILGSEEKCNGETARRMGEEGRFQELVLQNIETFKKYNVKKIVTACPHCYNTFKNEYPKFGLSVEVEHHSKFLADLVDAGKLRVKRKEESVTLHDPCYLGRINGEYDNTRFIVNSFGNLTEMEKSRQNSMCCGAGGGNYWYKMKSQDSISHLRMQQALDTKAGKLAVACPFCNAMMDDASRSMDAQDKIEIKDISELISEILEN
ncbi:MAG: heterodisulfide reductase-related iron-sulfur binding cluster [Thermoplasmatales archaeon]|nr:heterodisulfide reductase-related iron-sulfur binding cluster [Thermoplasmatales archaeon]